MSYLVNANLSYEADKALKENPELHQAFTAKFGEESLSWHRERVLDQAEVEWCEANGIKLDIKRVKGMTGPTSQAEVIARHVTQIAVPNIGLLTIDEVLLLDNACTDDLQAHLDIGWRMLAICPPNSTRRPDYILGRTRDATSL